MKYEKPVVAVQDVLAEGVYLASGADDGDIAAGVCGSAYLNGEWHKPHRGIYEGTNIDVKGCEGCPGDDGDGCKILKGEYIAGKDYRPTWERDGESPDKKGW